MTPSSFRLLINNFTALTPAEYAIVGSLATEYPYCQVLHIVAARAAKDMNRTEQQDRLHRAAVYSTDRSVVKWAISAPVAVRISPVPAEVISLPPNIENIPHPVAVSHTIEAVPAPAKARAITLEGDALREDLSYELKRLQQLKHDFEASYEALKQTIHPDAGPASYPSNAKEPPLIEEIKATRKKLKTPSPKVAEQGEIIDQFIKVAPTLPKVKVGEPSVDLAKDSVNYGDNIVSETLVNILVKQGKTVKAIEMLKKLIWKFPQKKAYFAAQIEALKN